MSDAERFAEIAARADWSAPWGSPERDGAIFLQMFEEWGLLHTALVEIADLPAERADEAALIARRALEL